MADCEHALELISLGLDRLLTQEEQRELDGHLEACQPCRALALELAQLHEALNQMGECEVPEDFADRVLEAIRQEQAAPPPGVIPFWRRSGVKCACGLAACAVLCIGLWRGVSGLGMGGGMTALSVPAASTPDDLQVSGASAGGASASVETAPYAIMGAQADGKEALEEAVPRAMPPSASSNEAEAAGALAVLLGEPPGQLLVLDGVPEVLAGEDWQQADGMLWLALTNQQLDEAVDTLEAAAYTVLPGVDGGPCAAVIYNN